MLTEIQNRVKNEIERRLAVDTLPSEVLSDVVELENGWRIGLFISPHASLNGDGLQLWKERGRDKTYECQSLANINWRPTPMQVLFLRWMADSTKSSKSAGVAIDKLWRFENWLVATRGGSLTSIFDPEGRVIA